MLENHGEPWTEAEIERLTLLKGEGKTETEISKILGRTKSAINARWHYIKHGLGDNTRTWKHEETEVLIALAETMPFSQLFIRYNQIAVKKGYRKRTMLSVQSKLLGLGQSITPNSGWYGISAIAVGLGFSKSRIHGWISAGLKHHVEGKNFYVRNDNLVAYILSHPNCLEGISNDGLRWFIALLNEEKEMRNHDGRPEFARSLTA